jgi:hypothetical protein
MKLDTEGGGGRGDILAGRASVSADQKRVGNQLFLTHYKRNAD